jgi:sugar phosphate isomerase/epimerase
MKLCYEPDELNKYVDTLNKQGDHFVALVDVGHAECSGYKADEFIRIVGHERLKGLHIQDSDGVRDLHQLPFTQKFDWNAITKSLADIDYTGDFTFEADKFLRLFPAEMVEDASRFMLNVGKQLVKMIERHKTDKK